MPSVRISGRSFIKAIIFCLFGLIFLNEFNRLIPFPDFLEQGVYGDDGDGFFNLWVMKHNVMYLGHGRFSDFFDGRIFFPENKKTLLWSDLNLLPSAIFAAYQKVWHHPFAAFNLTVLSLFCLGTMAYIFFFYSIVKTSAREFFNKNQLFSWVMILAFSFATSFAFVRYQYFIHVQNFSSFWIFIILGASLHFINTFNKKWLAFAMFGMIAVTYSSAYYTVLGGILMLWFGIYCMLHFPSKDIKDIVKRAWYIPIIGGLMMAPVILAYKGEHVTGNSIRRPFAFSFSDLFTPKSGIPVHAWLQSWFGKLPEQNHENLAFLGVATIFGALLLCSLHWRGLLSGLRFLTGKVWWSTTLIGLACFHLLKHNLPQDYHFVMAQGFLLLIALVFFWFMGRLAMLKLDRLPVKSLHSSQSRISILAFLIGATVITYALALGATGENFEDINLSLWYLFAKFAPGVHKMRAIGRLGGVGHVLVLGICCIGLTNLACRARESVKGFGFLKSLIHRKEFALTILLSLTVLHTFENRKKVYFNRYNSSFFQLGPHDSQFLENIESPVLAYPFYPIHRSTYHMLTLLPYPNIWMINGYSGKFTKAFDDVAYADQGRLSGQSVQNAVDQGVGVVLINKKLIGQGEFNSLKKQWPNKLYESAHIYVFDPKG